MSDYTPTTDEVRYKYVEYDMSHTDDCTECPAEFDRWLAAHDAETELDALTAAELLMKQREAEIRADEREKAAQQVAALEPTQDYGFMRVWRDEAINAARGYSDGTEFTRAAARGEDKK